MPYIFSLIVVIVGVDLFFLRHHLLARLIVNIGIVLLFAIVYLCFHSAFTNK